MLNERLADAAAQGMSEDQICHLTKEWNEAAQIKVRACHNRLVLEICPCPLQRAILITVLTHKILVGTGLANDDLSTPAQTFGEAVADALKVKGKDTKEWLAQCGKLNNRDARALAKALLGEDIFWCWEAPRTAEGYYRVLGGTEYAIHRHIYVCLMRSWLVIVLSDQHMHWSLHLANRRPLTCKEQRCASHFSSRRTLTSAGWSRPSPSRHKRSSSRRVSSLSTPSSCSHTTSARLLTGTRPA